MISILAINNEECKYASLNVCKEMQNYLFLNNLFLFFIAMIAGALVPFQAGSNATLGKTLGHPLWATSISLMVSVVITLSIIALLRIAKPELTGVLNMPLWAWGGGVIGAIYVTCALMLTPRLGATSFIVCVIAGQLIASLLIDYFGLVGLPEKEVNFGRITGVIFVFLGSLLVHRFSV